MPKCLTLNVFISCPGDVTSEKNALIKFIQDKNTEYHTKYQITLDVVDWESDLKRSEDRSQKSANIYLEKTNIYIGMMWKKYGTDTGLVDSGTFEEYIIANLNREKRKNIEILFFFKDFKIDTNTSDEDLDQFEEIRKFKNRLIEQHRSPIDFKTKNKFLDIINKQLDLILKDWRSNHPEAITSEKIFSEKEDAIDVLQEYRKFLIDQYDTVTIFKDKSFRLKDIYVSLRLEINPQMWHEMGDAEFVRKLSDDELPERYREVMGTMEEHGMKRSRGAIQKGSTGDELVIDDVLKASDRAVILGEAGSGKTTLFYHIIATYSDLDKNYIPVYLPIGYWLKCKLCDPIHAFCTMLKEDYYSFPSKHTDALEKDLNRFWKDNKIILLLDGLDEIDQEALKQVCTRLNNVDAGSNKVLVSCRRTSYDRQLKGKTWWVYSINPFSKDDRLQFMLNYFDDATDARALSILVEYLPRLRSLGQNPLLMGLICYIYDEKDKHQLPEERVVLYERCVDQLLMRREKQKFKDYNDFKKQFLTHLAYHFFTIEDKKKREWFPKPEVIKLAIEFRNRQSKSENLAVPDADKIDEFIKELSDINSLLQPVAANSYCFPHRSFQEYFAARYLDQAKDGFRLVTEKLCEDDFWTETICLYAGMPSQSNATDLINALGKKGKIGLILKLIPDTIRIDWDKLDKETLNWKIRRGAVEQLVLPEVDPGKKDELTDVLRGILCGAQPDVNANVRYSALIALERIGTPQAMEIVNKQHIIPQDVILEAKPFDDELHDPDIKIKINQPGMPPNMVLIKGGSYVMGETKKEVSVDDFYMSIFPVTNWEYRRFVDDKGYERKRFWSEEGWKSRQENKWNEPRYWDDIQFNQEWQPVVGVSWYEAAAYCRWYTQFLKAKTPIRLPTEEEWEYAARGPHGSEWSFGAWDENIPRWDSYFEYENGLTRSTSRVNTVYKKSVNDYGLFEMSGNVWEWTSSWYDKDKVARVLRGGSWSNGSVVFLRCAFRYYDDPGDGVDYWGFRCVQALRNP